MFKKRIKLVIIMIFLCLTIGCSSKETLNEQEKIEYKTYGRNTIVLTLEDKDYELDEMNRSLAWQLLCESPNWYTPFSKNYTNEEIEKKSKEALERFGYAAINVSARQNQHFTVGINFEKTEEQLNPVSYKVYSSNSKGIETYASINGIYTGMNKETMFKVLGNDYEDLKSTDYEDTYYYKAATKSGKEAQIIIIIGKGINDDKVISVGAYLKR